MMHLGYDAMHACMTNPKHERISPISASGLRTLAVLKLWDLPRSTTHPSGRREPRATFSLRRLISAS